MRNKFTIVAQLVQQVELKIEAQHSLRALQKEFDAYRTESHEIKKSFYNSQSRLAGIQDGNKRQSSQIEQYRDRVEALELEIVELKAYNTSSSTTTPTTDDEDKYEPYYMESQASIEKNREKRITKNTEAYNAEVAEAQAQRDKFHE